MSDVILEFRPPFAAKQLRENQFGILCGMLRTICFYDPGSGATYLGMMQQHGLLSDDEAAWLKAELRLDQPRRLRLGVPLGASPPLPSRPGSCWENHNEGGDDGRAG